MAKSWNQIFVQHKPVNPTVIIASPEGGGKTHWAFENSPGPHFLIETEGDHNADTANKMSPDHWRVTILRDPSERPTQKWHTGRSGMWDQAEETMLALMQPSCPSGTVIIDSGSDLHGMVVACYSIDWNRGDKAFPTMLYGQIYTTLNSYIHNLRQKHNVIITAKMKDEWKGESKTGKKVMSIWNTAEYQVEHIIYITGQGDEREFHVRRKKGELLTVDNITWDELESGFDPEKVIESKKKKLRERIENAVEAFQKKGWEYDPVYSDDLKSMEAKIEELLDQYKEKLLIEKENRAARVNNQSKQEERA